MQLKIWPQKRGSRHILKISRTQTSSITYFMPYWIVQTVRTIIVFDINIQQMHQSIYPSHFYLKLKKHVHTQKLKHDTDLSLPAKFVHELFVCLDQTTAPLILIVLAILYGHDLRILFLMEWRNQLLFLILQQKSYFQTAIIRNSCCAKASSINSVSILVSHSILCIFIIIYTYRLSDPL